MTDAPYSEGTWKGRPNYRCARCPFDSLDQLRIDAHVEEHRTADLVLERRALLRAPAEPPPDALAAQGRRLRQRAGLPEAVTPPEGAAVADAGASASDPAAPHDKEPA